MQHIKRAGALAFSVGLLASPSGIVAAQDDAAVPGDGIVYVTAEVVAPPQTFIGREETKVGDVAGGFEFAGQATLEVGLEFSDPRLGGTLSIVSNGIVGPIEGGEALVAPSSFRLVSDVCEWTGEGVAISADLLDPDTGDFQEELIGTEVYSLAGSGECDGLTAYLITSFGGPDVMPTVEGLILPAEIPGLPAPVAAHEF